MAVRSTPLGPDVLNDGDWGNVPEQLGPRREPLYPGPYRFKLPVLAALKTSIQSIKATIDGKPDQPRIAAVLRDGAELTVVQSPGGTRNGDAFATRVSNAERRRGKKDDPKAPFASDMDYLLKALQEPKRPQTNQQYQAALERHAEGEFGADVEWNGFCNPERPIRVYESETSERTVPLDGEDQRELVKGCGARYYGRDIPKGEDGKYLQRFDCTCGAVLFVNENLTNFRA